MIGLLWKSAEEAKKSDDSTGKMLAKVGLLLVTVSEAILLVSDLIDYRKEKIENTVLGNISTTKLQEMRM